jgi:hypothetical protein
MAASGRGPAGGGRGLTLKEFCHCLEVMSKINSCLVQFPRFSMVNFVRLVLNSYLPLALLDRQSSSSCKPEWLMHKPRPRRREEEKGGWEARAKFCPCVTCEGQAGAQSVLHVLM